MKYLSKILLISFLAVFSLFTFTQSAIAAPFAIDGDLSDWNFTYTPYQGFNPSESAGNEVTGLTDGIYWWEEDSTTSYLGPGWGGQIMDVEGLYATVYGGSFYFAVVTGQNGTIGASTFEPGDIIINLGSGGQYAVETTGYRFNLDGSGYVGSATATGSAGNLYQVDSEATLIPGLINWSGEPDNQDPVQIGAIASDGVPIEFAYDYEPTAADHYYMEGRIDLDLLGINPGDVDTVNFHFAISCGNDGGMTPDVPIPEPAAMLLLGTGLIGMAGLGRKKFRKS